MNVYDFDKTIYRKDSSVAFYAFIIRRHPLVFFRCVWRQLKAFIGYACHRISKEQLKEGYFSFLHYIDAGREVDLFVSRELANINAWYKEQQAGEDVIISASPRFLVEAFAEQMGVQNVIASEVDKKTGKFLSRNCHGAEKVERFYRAYPDAIVENFYSDSQSDYPMAKVAKKAFLVKGGVVKAWQE